SLARMLDGMGLVHIRLLEIESEPEEDAAEENSEERRKRLRQMARKTFSKAMSTVKDVMNLAGNDEEINVAQTKRVIHNLIDRIAEDESSMIELTALRNFDEYTYVHSTNVCVYALTIGVRIGLDRARLAQLGLAALFHDIGKVRLSSDLINKPGAFDEDDWVQMQRHPILGSKTALRNLELDIHTARVARVCFEHHINADFTGYPLLRYGQRPSNLFSRIVAIVDTFDALTSGRVYIKHANTSDEVIRKMHYQMAIKFDALLLKTFTDVVGVYPAGSLVLLSTDEVALVLSHNEIDRTRPQVKIIGDRSGMFEEPIFAELTDGSSTDRYITRIIDAEKHGIDLSRIISAD
ncbi:MAG: HD domain-containing phosphohydrolase, partial [candidate division Zixibacteria bacterium]